MRDSRLVTVDVAQKLMITTFKNDRQQNRSKGIQYSVSITIDHGAAVRTQLLL
jgi:hypothetical protein